MSDENKKDEPKVQADNNSIAVGNISAGGSIGDINIKTGFTSDQVSVLITQIQSTFQPKPFDGRCPYKGLDFFEEEDAELFFGREKLVDDLVSCVKDSRTVFVTGPSGSGKSSLVRAGLIHALKSGALKESHSENWLYATMKPGRDPIAEIARATAGLANSTNAEDEIRAKALNDATIFVRWCEIALKDGRDKRVILFVDQFEEVFTQIGREAERVAFLNLLTHAATVENGRVIILFSMRSDFISNCATYPQLNELLNSQFKQIGAMQPDELVSAIAQPALRVGLKIDPDLIAQIINEMQGEPGALPLMQFALKDLFDLQQAKDGLIALTLKDYLERGGMRKALERHADDSFSKLSKNEQELARSIFSGLIEIGRGTQDTKRTALFDELVPANTNAADVDTIVRKLADARLVTTDEAAGKDTVTISHEKLIDAWPWLKKLVNENRDVIALQNEIAEDAKEWEDNNRDSSYLYSGARLATAQEKMVARKLVLSARSQEFIEEGIALQEREKKAKETLRRRITTGLVSGIVIAMILAGIAVYQMLQAQKQAKIVRVDELAAQAVSLRDTNFPISLLLGVEAFNALDDRITSVQAQSALLGNSLANPRLEQFLSGNTGPVVSAIFSPDGKILASGTYDKDILLWDVTTRQRIGQLSGNSYVVRSVAFSPDGKTLASGSQDATITLWNMETRQAIGQPLGGDSGHSRAITSVAFSPDGTKLASGSEDTTIILWDVKTSQPIRRLNEHTDIVRSVAFSPDGKTLASGSDDGMIILWDVKTGEPVGNRQVVYPHSFFGGLYIEDVPSPVLSVAFGPDGMTLASGDYDGNVTLWDAQTSEPIYRMTLSRHSGIVRTLAFSPDGKTLASGSADRTVILWDTETGQFRDQLRGHSDLVNSLSFSPDGSTLASGSGDTTIILWNMNQNQPLARPLSGYIHQGQIPSIVFSPDGKTLASGSGDKTIMLWDVKTGQATGQALSGHTASVNSITFSPDGKILASGSCGKFNEKNLCTQGEIILWDVKTRKAIVSLSGHTASVNSVAFSPDGKTLASGSGDKTIILWDVKTRQAIDELSGHTASVNSVAFSTDGKTLASGSGDKTIILWDVKTRQAIDELSKHLYAVTSIAFSPDGRTLASGSEDSTINLWDLTFPQQNVTLSGHSASITSLAFSPDGNKLASGSLDQTIILWDVKTNQLIGVLRDTSFIRSVAFSPDRDSKTLASSSAGITLWDLNELLLINVSCQRAGHNFTLNEWKRYFPGEEYRKTCPEFPLEPAATPTGIP